MDQSEVQMLFQKFAAPLTSYAAISTERRQLAEMLSRNLWTALIAGPEAEDETWKVLRIEGNLDCDLLEPLQQCYYEQMKPSVSQEQLVALRAKYRTGQVTKGAT
jgi:hypothetical protein